MGAVLGSLAMLGAMACGYLAALNFENGNAGFGGLMVVCVVVNLCTMLTAYRI